VDFPTSGAPRARPAFIRGIALLHSFEYVDAAEAFREAQRLDPAFAMAYWAEALTHRHPLWAEEDLPAARAVLSRLGRTTSERLAKAPTRRELAYAAAIEALFSDADEETRARAFADSMRSVARAYPRDMEAQAFAALGLLGLYRFGSLADRVRAGTEAGELARRVFEARPQHPGAAHYLIHAYDDPELAPRGLDAARAYAAVAPDAEHALHMPSHIFVQLGLWHDVAMSNERSWAASRAWVQRRVEKPTALDFHSLQWLQYAYLQQGRWALARSLVDTARVLLTNVNHDGGQVDARHAVASLAFQWMAETGQWDLRLADLVRAKGRDTSTLRGRVMAANGDYQTAYARAMMGDTLQAAALVTTLRVRPNLTAPLRLRLARLEAVIARHRKDSAAELAALERAAVADSEIPAYGPPGQPPASEALAGALRRAGRSAEALVSLERTLKRFPNRATALLALGRVHDERGSRAAAERTRATLRESWVYADAPVVALLRDQSGPVQAGKRP
jgi:hypothetical protein